MKPTVDAGPLGAHPLASRRDRSVSDDGPRRGTIGSTLNTLDWRQALGGALIALGMVAIIIAWWQISGTPHPGEQMPPFASGGLGGAALVAIGVLLLNSFEHAQDRQALFEVLERIDEVEATAQASDQRTLEELERLTALLTDGSNANGRAGRTRRPAAKGSAQR